jgi:Ca-activated chloride channel family protein
MTRTNRRPVIPQVQPDARFPDRVLVELAFPSSVLVVDALLTTFLNEIIPPSHTIFVLDTSGSMDGARIDDLKRAMDGLAGVDTSLAGTFAQFRNRESVTIIPFSDTVDGASTFTIRGTDPTSPERLGIRLLVDHLVPGGNTAIYTALARAYREALDALAEDPGRLTSIVLMTDGENNSGMSPSEFFSFLRSLPAAALRVPTYPVLFGDADPDELRRIAAATGGKVFDSRTASLSQAFREIRGYQ